MTITPSTIDQALARAQSPRRLPKSGSGNPDRIAPGECHRLLADMPAMMKWHTEAVVPSMAEGVGLPEESAQGCWEASIRSLMDCQFVQHSDVGLTKMIHAASLNAPLEKLDESDFPSPSGVCFFAEPIVADLYGQSRRISAVSWESMHITVTNEDGSIHELFPGNGATSRASVVTSWELHGDSVWVAGASLAFTSANYDDLDVGPSLVRAIAAMNRSPLIGERGSEKAAKSNRSKPRPASAIRRSYLRKPEYADLELDAARDKNYSPMRGHWVRGYLRRQWDPSTQEHIKKWVPGYRRGDDSLGTINGPKILIGQSDRPGAAESRSDSDTKTPSEKGNR